MIDQLRKDNDTVLENLERKRNKNMADLQVLLMNYREYDDYQLHVMFCAMWYHLYNLKSVKNTHGVVILLLKLQTEACNFTKSETSP